MTLKQLLHHLNLRSTRLIPSKKFFLTASLVIISGFSLFFSIKTITASEITNTPTNQTNSTINQNYIKQKQDAIQKGNNQEAWLDSALGSNIVSTQIMLSGTIPDDVLNQKIDEYGNIISFNPEGMIGNTNKIIASLYTPPASGVEYIAHIKNNFLGKPAYAQTGFEGLNGILKLWKGFRNMTYILISIIFIIIGLMIMLRVKVSPQTVITIQSSIPKIITTLILITFSYAIAGFCIDIINLFQFLSISTLFNSLEIGFDDNLFHLNLADFSITNLLNLIRSLFGDNAFNFNALSKANFGEIYLLIRRLVPTWLLIILSTVIGAIIGGISGHPIIGGTIGGAAFLLITSIIIFVHIIKFTIGLAKCYVTALIKIIIGPFEILLGALPNSKVGFSSWIISIIANLAVFPISILFLIMANIISDSIGGAELWAPTLIIGPTKWFLPMIVGITSIFMLSKLPELIPQAIFQIKPSPYENAIGESLAGPTKFIKGTTSSGIRSGVIVADELGNSNKSGNWWQRGAYWANKIINRK